MPVNSRLNLRRCRDTRNDSQAILERKVVDDLYIERVDHGQKEGVAFLLQRKEHFIWGRVAIEKTKELWAEAGTGNIGDGFETELRRDERIMRFLTVKMEKYGIEYAEKRRKKVKANA